MRTSYLAGSAAIALLLLAASSASAGNGNAAAAEKLFNDAKAAMSAGKIGEACDMFAASDKLDPSASTLMNLADCRERNGQFATAWEAYVSVERRVAGDGRYGKMTDIAHAHAQALEPRLSYLTISVADEVRIEGLEVLRDGVAIEQGAWNRALPIDGGVHTISARAPANETWSTTVTVAPENDKQQVDLPKLKAIRHPNGKTVIITRTSPSMFTKKRKIAIGVAGGGVLAVAAGAVLGLRAQRLQDKADGTCPQTMCSPDQAQEATNISGDAHQSAIFADAAFGVGAAAIGVGAYLWLTGKPVRIVDQPEKDTDEGVSFAPRVSPDYVGFAAAVRF